MMILRSWDFGDMRSIDKRRRYVRLTTFKESPVSRHPRVQVKGTVIQTVKSMLTTTTAILESKFLSLSVSREKIAVTPFIRSINSSRT